MRATYRFLLIVESLFMLVLTAAAIAVALGWRQPFTYLPGFLSLAENRWGVVATAALLLVIALYLLVSAGSGGRENRRQFLIQETGLGTVEIAASALENLVCRASRSIREVRDVRPVLLWSQEGVSIILHLNLIPDANLPAATEAVQQAVQSFLEQHAGVRVLRIEVRVDSVSLEPRTRVE